MWKAFAEQFKECGRNGTLFIFAVTGTAPLLYIAAALVEETGRWIWLVFAGAWLLVFGAPLACFVRNWRHPVRLGKLPPLSRHDRCVARSKLLKHHPR